MKNPPTLLSGQKKLWKNIIPEICFGNSGDYYLWINDEKSWLGLFFDKNSIFGRKMGVAATLAPKGLRVQDPPKSLAHRVELMGQALSQKKSFQKFSAWTPP